MHNAPLRSLALQISRACLLLLPLLAPHIAFAQRTMLIDDLHHLRSREGREWSDFPEDSEGPKLTATFKVDPAAKPQTLGLRRVDVKEKWQIAINGRKLVDLFADENDMHQLCSIPADYLIDGDNIIVVEATSDKLDDIKIGDVWIDTRSKDDILNECTLDLLAIDENGPIPARFTILGEDGALAAIADDVDPLTAIRAGVVYTGTGVAKIGIPAGKYKLYCGRGFEYSLASQTVELNLGDKKEQQFKINREVDTTDYIACDTHVHTLQVSGHGDASLEDRMVTLAGEGIELAIATEHNIFTDYGPTQRELGLQKYFKPIIGDEVTTRFGHFNAFAGSAAATLPDHGADDWSSLMKSIRGPGAMQFVILNHPRDLHSNFRPFGPENMIAATGKRLDGRTLEVDAMELINSSALQSDPMLLFHDWMTQVNRGMRLNAVGASDSHEVSMKIVGQGRTYIRINDTNPIALNWENILAAMYGGKMLVSLGLFIELKVDSQYHSGDFYTEKSDDIEVEFDIRNPVWNTLYVVELYANDVLVKSNPVWQKYSLPDSPLVPRFWIDRPKHDIQLVAVARGHSDAALAWPIARPYQPTSPDWKPYIFGSSGIVRVDCDGDGKWTSASEYASEIVDRSEGDLAKAVKELKDYDMTIATFFAEAWTQRFTTLRDESDRAIWQKAFPKTRDGIQKYLDSERASTQAKR